MDEQPDRPPREGGPFAPGNLRTQSGFGRVLLAVWAIAGLLLVVLVILVVTGR